MTQELLIKAANLGDDLIRTVVPDAVLVINPDEFPKKIKNSRVVFLATCKEFVKIWVKTEGFSQEEIKEIVKFMELKAADLNYFSGHLLKWRWIPKLKEER